MFYVYVLKSKNHNQIYIGFSSNLKKRLSEHNNGEAVSIKKYMPWRLVYYEAYETEKLARTREKRLKQHGNVKRELKKRIGLPPTKTGAGFTLIELIIVVAILMLLGALSVPFFQSFQVSSELYTLTDEVTRILRYSQTTAASGQNNDSWGVYFDESAKKFILYKGANYLSHDVPFDLEFEYNDIFSMANNFSNDINFAQNTGLPSISNGTITLTSTNNQTNQIDISSIGLINASY